MTTKLNRYIFAGAACFLLTWLFVGIFRDSEFYEPEIFTKYRPTFKVFFHTPIGEGSLQLKDLAKEKQTEEINFQEFVIKQHQQYNSSARLWFLPFILIQLTLTFLSFGLYKTRRSFSYKPWQLPIHFFLNLIITSIGFSLLLMFDKLVATIVISLTILCINSWTTYLLTKQKLKLATHT
jgi:hypothetical protein